MDKLLINLEIPSILESYEIFIQSDIKIEELIELITTSLTKITNGQYMASGQEVLCMKRKNIKLDNYKFVYNYEIVNGETLLLI